MNYANFCHRSYVSILHDLFPAILLAITKPKCAQLIAADIERSSTSCCNRQDDSVGDRRQLVNWRFAFETENIRLSQQLEREREAVRDEEIVRNLATRSVLLLYGVNYEHTVFVAC